MPSPLQPGDPPPPPQPRVSRQVVFPSLRTCREILTRTRGGQVGLVPKDIRLILQLYHAIIIRDLGTHGAITLRSIGRLELRWFWRNWRESGRSPKFVLRVFPNGELAQLMESGTAARLAMEIRKLQAREGVAVALAQLQRMKDTRERARERAKLMRERGQQRQPGQDWQIKKEDL